MLSELQRKSTEHGRQTVTSKLGNLPLQLHVVSVVLTL